MKENPLQQGNFEVEAGTANQPLTRVRKCCVLCSRESIVVYVLLLSITCGHFYTFARYAKGISFAREGVWVFFALGTLSCLLLAWFLVRTCVAAAQKGSGETKERTLPPFVARAMSCYNTTFDINGKYHLIKMYFAEALEHAQQAYSLSTIYLCQMPVGISSAVCVVLMVELAINIWATFRIASQEVRNRLILLDVFTDLFCMAFPLLYIQLSFGIPIAMNEMLLITVYPSLSLLSKLYDIWEDYFNMDVERTKQQGRTSRRMSVLKLSHNQKSRDMQLKYFPNWLRYSFTLLNLGFMLFFGSLAGVHLSTQPTSKECSEIFTEEVWGACMVSVPFCQDLLVAKCDCAVIEMVNYTQKTLPDSFEGLSSLAILGLHNGVLEELPKPIGDNQKRLRLLGVTGNRIRSLPESVGRLNNLVWLYVQRNRLESLPESVGGLQNLAVIIAANNQLESLPNSLGSLNNLNELTVFSNQLQSLPVNMGGLKNLIHLRVFNNQLESLPASMGKLENLLEIIAWNNSLTSLPETAGNMKSLTHVDVRHNKLDSLPASASKWSKMEYLYLAGNPLCPDLDIPSNLKQAKGLCETQCSVDCFALWLGDGLCDDNSYNYADTKDIDPTVEPKPNSGCNTAACDYDKGDCFH